MIDDERSGRLVQGTAIGLVLLMPVGIAGAVGSMTAYEAQYALRAHLGWIPPHEEDGSIPLVLEGDNRKEVYAQAPTYKTVDPADSLTLIDEGTGDPLGWRLTHRDIERLQPLTVRIAAVEAGQRYVSERTATLDPGRRRPDHRRSDPGAAAGPPDRPPCRAAGACSCDHRLGGGGLHRSSAASQPPEIGTCTVPELSSASGGGDWPRPGAPLKVVARTPTPAQPPGFAGRCPAEAGYRCTAAESGRPDMCSALPAAGAGNSRRPRMERHDLSLRSPPRPPPPYGGPHPGRCARACAAAR